MKQNDKFFKWSVLIISFLFLCQCHPTQLSSNLSTTDYPDSFGDDVGPDLTEKLIWENKIPESARWSQHVYTTLDGPLSDLLNLIPEDIERFCPRYSVLTKRQRINFWGQLIAAMAKFESGWRPNNRYVETTMGPDMITGETIASEGLLQVSYQDSKLYSGCEFDWSIDKELHKINPSHPMKTIFNPEKNITCGLNIMKSIIVKRGRIATSVGAYWAVLKPTNPRNKLTEISAITNGLLFCR